MWVTGLASSGKAVRWEEEYRKFVQGKGEMGLVEMQSIAHTGSGRRG